MTPLMPKRIVDYATLKKAIASTANRSDLEFMEAINNFIMMAESLIYTDLRTPANEVMIEHDPSTDGKTMDMPAGMLEIRDVYREGLPIDRLTADEYHLANAGKSNKKGYARFGHEIFFVPELSVDPLDKDVVKMAYWVDWSLAWENDGDTNPLLLGNPDLYLWGALVEAFVWLEDEQRSQFYEGRFKNKINDIKKQARNDDQSGGDMQIRGRYL